MTGASRGSSERTRSEILEAARELFAARGISEVTVRDIAARAGVTHALVHRYFGTKEEMLAEILRREVQAASSLPVTAYAGAVSPLDVIRQMLLYGLTDARTTLLLITRAELAGLEPEKMLQDDQFRPIGMMADWLKQQQAQAGAAPAPSDEGAGAPAGVTRASAFPEVSADEERPLPGPRDAALVSAVVGAAVFGLQILAPWLMTAVGLSAGHAAERRQEIVDILMDLVTSAAAPATPACESPGSERG